MNKIGLKLLQENTLKEELLYHTGKHKGGLKSTEKLVELCNLKNGGYVLDVGCGIGTTPCFLAKKFGCKVVGVDLNEKMVEWSKQRAKKERVEDKVEFRVADAQNLPFEDETFDVTFSQAVDVLVDDKQKAVNEYRRVTKQGGYVGLHEGTWLKTPTKEIIDLFIQSYNGVYNAGLQGYDSWINEFTTDGWVTLLKNAGLKEITAQSYKATPQTKLDGMKTIGIRHTIRMWILFIISPTFRRMTATNIPEEIHEYYGYGLYVGKKVR